MSFENVLKSVLEFEGGYVNDPDDAGGETFRGISRANNPGWQGWKLIDKAKEAGFRSAAAIDRYFKSPSSIDALVAQLYRASYWKPFEGQPPLPARVMDKLFDAGVNVGLKRASILLQEALNGLGSRLAADGKIGPLTRAEVGHYTDAEILVKYCARQAAFYEGIVRNKPGQRKFLAGWLRRAAWLPSQN